MLQVLWAGLTRARRWRDGFGEVAVLKAPVEEEREGNDRGQNDDANAEIERQSPVAPLKSRVMSDSPLRNQLMISVRVKLTERRIDCFDLQVLHAFVVDRFLAEEDHQQAAGDCRLTCGSRTRQEWHGAGRESPPLRSPRPAVGGGALHPQLSSTMSSRGRLKSRAILKASARLGSCFPVSMSLIVWRDTPSSFARSPCDHLLDARSSRSRFVIARSSIRRTSAPCAWLPQSSSPALGN